MDRAIVTGGALAVVDLLADAGAVAVADGALLAEKSVSGRQRARGVRRLVAGNRVDPEPEKGHENPGEGEDPPPQGDGIEPFQVGPIHPLAQIFRRSDACHGSGVAFSSGSRRRREYRPARAG